MENVQFGFVFHISGSGLGRETTTLYSEANSRNIARALADGRPSIEVVHIIQRGPRAGHEDVHIIDFKSKIVYSDKTGSRYRLTSVYSTPTIIDKSTATTDTLIAKLKSERKLAKMEYENAKIAYEAAKAKYESVIKSSDAQILALVTESESYI